MNHHSVLLKKNHINSIDGMSAEHSMSPHSIFFATFIRVLSLIQNSKNIATGYITNNMIDHPKRDVSQLSLLNSVSAVGLALDEESKWIDLLIKCDSILKAVEKKNDLKKASTSEIDNKKTYFQTAFRVINNTDDVTAVSEFHKDYLEHFGTEFPLLMTCLKGEDQQVVEVHLNYNTDFYDAERIRAFGDYFLKVLDLLIDDSSAYCFNNNLISNAEINKIIQIGSGEVIKLVEESALQKICNSIESNPDNILVEDQDRKMTGLDVASRVNDLVTQLQLKSFKQKVIAVSLPRGTDWVCSLVAIMSEGAIYLPIDLSVPPSRVRTILVEAKAEAVICTSDQVEQLANIISVDDIALLVTPNHRGKVSELTVSAKWSDKAYVLFTSGSTGVPKGALLEHSGMANHLLSKIIDLDLTREDVIAQTAPVTFDISVWQSLIGLYCGARTVVYSKSQQLSIESFFEEITSDKISMLEVVPSYFSLMLDYLEKRNVPLTYLRILVLTGEPLKHEQVKRWFSLYPSIEIVNAYGPTECSDDITHHRFQVLPERNIVPIGKPICNMRIHILDRNDECVPYGTLGNICVSGIGVGLGYINSNEKTAEAFDFNHDLAKWSTGRLYRTGDIGKWSANGELEYFGRHEEQIKIRGMRVELGEIENAILEIENIKDAAVTFNSDTQILTGYYIGDPSKNLIFETLVNVLPSYMVPRNFISCKSFPLNSAGKTDKNQLKDIFDSFIEVPAESNLLDTGMEKKIAKAWSMMLNVNEAMINKSSNFFHLGGDSLLAAAVISLLDGLCTLNELYSHKNIEQLANNIQVKQSESTSA